MNDAAAGGKALGIVIAIQPKSGDNLRGLANISRLRDSKKRKEKDPGPSCRWKPRTPPGIIGALPARCDVLRLSLGRPITSIVLVDSP